MDRAEIERLLKQVNAEKAALEPRMAALTTAADSLQALLETTPAPEKHAAEAVSARETRRATPTRRHRSKKTPRGKEAAKLILQSDMSRHWNVREVDDEEVTLGWAERRLPGAKGNPPARIALQRLQEEYPQNVDVISEPVLAYKWIPQPSPSLNGSGASYAEEHTTTEVAEELV